MLGRRVFICGTAGLVLTKPLAALAGFSAPAARSLGLHNLHTGETLSTTYWADGAYVDGALVEIDRVLRDFRTGEVRPIDRALLDLLHDLRHVLGSTETFHVISGYRSPKTNQALAAKSGGVAKKSLHMRGMAIDVRLPGTQLSTLKEAAVALKLGGVGYYPKPDFVHLDVGRVRYW